MEQGSTFADALKNTPRSSTKLYISCARPAGGRYPRHHPQPSGGLPGEVGEAQAQGEGRDDLPGHRHPGRHRDGAPALEGDARVRGDVRELRLRLPAPTRFVVDLSRWAQDYWLYVFGSIAALVFSFSWSYKQPKGRKFWDKVFSKAPLFRTRAAQGRGGALTRTLGTMMLPRRSHSGRAGRDGRRRLAIARWKRPSTTCGARSPKAEHRPVRFGDQGVPTPWWCR